MEVPCEGLKLFTNLMYPLSKATAELQETVELGSRSARLRVDGQKDHTEPTQHAHKARTVSKCGKDSHLRPA